jgi:hypothetical protein
MRSRWLQEIFPGPDILARSLSVPTHKITFACKAGMASTYEVRAFDTLGRVQFKSRLSPPFSRFLYLDRYPELGFVHPSTGGIVLRQKGRVLIDEPIPTDRERFWEIFQTQWLPLLEASMAERLKKHIPLGQCAFWKDISIQVSLEETDLALPIGDERICPLEALHEDLYFVLLRHFASFARHHGIDASVHLGRVLPEVKHLPATGSPVARLTARPLSWPRAPGKASRNVEISPAPSALSMEGKTWQVAMTAPYKGAEAERFMALARAWGHGVTRSRGGAFRLELEGPAIRKKAKGPAPDHEPDGKRLLKAREVEGWIRRLSRSPHLGAWCVSRSTQDRPIFALEAFSAGEGDVHSVPKLRLLKPTLFFNARHHANEISGTNATLGMAWRVASTPKGQELLRDVNVIWIPMENVDGVATFEELLPTSKGHMLHAARYNALGAEFYEEYFEAAPVSLKPKQKRGSGTGGSPRSWWTITACRATSGTSPFPVTPPSGSGNSGFPGTLSMPASPL